MVISISAIGLGILMNNIPPASTEIPLPPPTRDDAKMQRLYSERINRERSNSSKTLVLVRYTLREAYVCVCVYCIYVRELTKRLSPSLMNNALASNSPKKSRSTERICAGESIESHDG